MGSKREVVVIPDYSRTPRGEKPESPASVIRMWLNGTDPDQISGTGQTYLNAASKIEQAVNALEEHAGRILTIWKGPDADRAKAALELLHATGNELSSKFAMMGDALHEYSGRLAEARTRVGKGPDVTSMVGTDVQDRAVLEEIDSVNAREVLHKLNKQIKDIYDVWVPQAVSLELPTVSILDAPVETRNPRYPTGSGSPSFGASGYDGGGSYGSGSYGSGSYGTGGGASSGGSGSGSQGSGGQGAGGQAPSNPGANPGDTNPGGSTPGGSTPGSTAPDGGNPDGGNPGGGNQGSNPDGGNSDGSNPGGGSGIGDPSTPGPATGDPNPAVPGQPQAPDTVPPVIGGDGTTATDGGPAATDPARTDVASYQPPTTMITNPAITHPPTTLTPPTTSVLPPATIPTGPPGPPSVIGSPGVSGGGPVTTLVSGAGRGLAGPSAGMPVMPFMGGGTAIGDHADLKRGTYLSEDATAWTTGHETTDPVIG